MKTSRMLLLLGRVRANAGSTNGVVIARLDQAIQ
jgi:hypothetical protein